MRVLRPEVHFRGRKYSKWGRVVTPYFINYLIYRVYSPFIYFCEYLRCAGVYNYELVGVVV